MSYAPVRTKSKVPKREAIYCDTCQDGRPLVTARLALPEEKRTQILEAKALGKKISTRWSLDFPARHECMACMRRAYGLLPLAERPKKAPKKISTSSCPSPDGQLELPS